MLKIENPNHVYDTIPTMAEEFARYQTDGVPLSTKDKIKVAIDVIKCLPIDGCITGSCLLPGFDPDGWGTTPDVDVFVFGENELVSAVEIARHALKMTPGSGTERSRKQEEWKLARLKQAGLNHKIGITTYKFYHDGVILNLTFKQRKFHGRWIPILDTPGVLQSFDMSIVMQGYDIKHHVLYDMRVGDPNVAIPNPLRDHDCVMWTVAKWVRQFDRVVKYYNRGFDTRPMARFYLDMIDECISAGCLFDSEESQEAFENFSSEFVEKRAAIADWYDAHKED
jgi:hypothetical protein